MICTSLPEVQFASDEKLTEYLHSGLLLSQGPACLWPGGTVAIGTVVAGQGWFKHPDATEALESAQASCQAVLGPWTG